MFGDVNSIFLDGSIIEQRIDRKKCYCQQDDEDSSFGNTGKVRPQLVPMGIMKPDMQGTTILE
jgi:hypothetical protein